MNDWRKYLKDRLIKECQGGFVVIIPDGASVSVPLACSICDHLMRSRDDESAHLEFGCCHRCALLWAHPRREAWRSGWRPSMNQVIEAEKDRLPLAFTFEVD